MFECDSVNQSNINEKHEVFLQIYTDTQRSNFLNTVVKLMDMCAKNTINRPQVTRVCYIIYSRTGKHAALEGSISAQWSPEQLQ